MERTPSPEKNLEGEILDLLTKLDNNLDVLAAHTELMKEWYHVEIEGRTNPDRAQAKDTLTAFLEKVEEIKRK